MPGQQGTSQDQSVDAGIDRKLQTTTIDETLANIEECSAFRKLIQDADLDYVLRRSGFAQFSMRFFRRFTSTPL